MLAKFGFDWPFSLGDRIACICDSLKALLGVTSYVMSKAVITGDGAFSSASNIIL